MIVWNPASTSVRNSTWPYAPEASSATVLTPHCRSQSTSPRRPGVWAGNSRVVSAPSGAAPTSMPAACGCAIGKGSRYSAGAAGGEGFLGGGALRGAMGSLTMGGGIAKRRRGGPAIRISRPNGIAAESPTTPCHQDAGRKRPPPNRTNGPGRSPTHQKHNGLFRPTPGIEMRSAGGQFPKIWCGPAAGQ